MRRCLGVCVVLLVSIGAVAENTEYWLAQPDQVNWLQQLQVPSFHMDFSSANYTYVTCVSWGSQSRLENEWFAALPASIQAFLDSGRPYVMGSSAFTANDMIFNMRPDLLDTACVDIDGMPCILPYLPQAGSVPFYWLCTNNPVWQDFLIWRNCAAVDLGLDGVHIDEMYGTSSVPVNAGGCFCEYCMAGFCEYLEAKYSPSTLASQFGIVDIASFDYGEYIRTRGYVDLWRDCRLDDVPLYQDYQTYQEQAALAAMRRIVGETRRYAFETYGKYIPFSTNPNDLNTSALKVADLVDLVQCEVDYGDPDAVFPMKMLPLAQLARSLGKAVCFLPILSTSAELLGLQSTDVLLKLMIADAYAGGGAFVARQDMWVHDPWAAASSGNLVFNFGAINHYYRFALDNGFLFENAQSPGRVGVLFPFCSITESYWNPAHEPFLDLISALYDASIQFDVVTVGDGDMILTTPQLEDLSHYSWIVIPERSSFPDSVVKILAEFTIGGGRILSYAPDVSRAIDEIGISQGIFRADVPPREYRDHPSDAAYDTFISSLPTGVLSSQVRVATENQLAERDVNAWAMTGDDLIAVHILNHSYDVLSDSIRPTGETAVAIPQTILPFEEHTAFSAYILSPDREEPLAADITFTGDSVEIRIDEIGIWTTLCLLTESRELELLRQVREELPHLAPGFESPQQDFETAGEDASAAPLVLRQQLREAAWTALRFPWSNEALVHRFNAELASDVPYVGEANELVGTCILFDEAHRERNTISSDRASELEPAHPEYRLFGRMAEDLSQIHQLDWGTGELARDVLEDYRLLIISAPLDRFGEEEIEQVEAFVKSGGGLLVLGDSHIGPPVNDLLRPFGIHLLEDGVIRSTSGGPDPEDVASYVSTANHCVTDGISVFSGNWGTAIDSTGEATVLLRSGADVWHDADADGNQDSAEVEGPFATGAALEYGEGRVVVLSDNVFIDWAWDGFESHRILFKQAIEWLLGLCDYSAAAVSEHFSETLVLDDFGRRAPVSPQGCSWIEYTWGRGQFGVLPRAAEAAGSPFLLLDAIHGGIGVCSELDSVDASHLDGVYLVVTQSEPFGIGLNLRSSSSEWPSGQLDSYAVVRPLSGFTQQVLRVPFSDLKVEEWRKQNCPDCETCLDPSRIAYLAIEIPEGHDNVQVWIHEVGFYKSWPAP